MVEVGATALLTGLVAELMVATEVTASRVRSRSLQIPARFTVAAALARMELEAMAATVASASNSQSEVQKSLIPEQSPEALAAMVVAAPRHTASAAMAATR